MVQVQKINQEAKEIGLGKEKFDILLTKRLKDRYRIKKAVESIDSLRRKCEGFNSVAEIRRWRGDI